MLNAQNVGFDWAKSMGGSSTEEGNSIAVDVLGNVYTTGRFWGTVDFDPGPGVFNLTTMGLQDIFISKLDSSGNFIWAKSIRGYYQEEGRSISVDASGNVYTTGYFCNIADFDPGPGVFNLSPVGSSDIFISKLDSLGNFVWAKSIGGITWDFGNSIAVDASENVYTTGYFGDTADFDPGTGIYNLSAVSRDIFISKLDSLGNFIWAKSMGGSKWDYGNSIAVDASGNVYTTGYFEDTADFDPGVNVYNLTSAGSSDIFISKLDSLGNFVWAKSMDGSSTEEGNSIAVDALGNIYTTGNYIGTVDFDPGPGVFNLTSAAGTYDIFVSKLDPSGNFIWAKSMGGNDGDAGFSVALDISGNVYTTGFFCSGIVDFDPGIGVFNITTAGVGDIFISKLDVSGNFVWAKSMGGIGGDGCYSIALDASGNIYTTGMFVDTVDFDPGAGVFNLISAGSQDVFIHKMSPTHTGINEFYFSETIIKVFPNPSNGQITISVNRELMNAIMKLTDIAGQQLMQKTNLSGNAFLVDISGIANGIYFLELSSDSAISRIKVVKN